MAQNMQKKSHYILLHTIIGGLTVLYFLVVWIDIVYLGTLLTMLNWQGLATPWYSFSRQQQVSASMNEKSIQYNEIHKQSPSK